MAKKKIMEEEIVDQKEEVFESFLKKEDLLAIEDLAYQVVIKGKDVSIAGLKLEKCQKEATLLSANYTLKLKESEELTRTLSQTKKEHKSILEQKADFKKQIAAKYNIPEDSDWGYHQITGEIVFK